MNKNRFDTKKLTTAAVMAALATVLIIITNFVPLSFSLLMVAALCFYVAFIKSGLVFGFLTIIASVMISFFVQPLSSAFFMTIIVFAPYSILAYFCQKIQYTTPIHCIIRLGIVLVFAALSFIGVYFLAAFIDFDIMFFVEKVGAVFVAIVFIVAAGIFDVLFLELSKRLLKVLK